MDVHFDDEVWNQPVRRYKILQDRPVSRRAASVLMAGAPITGEAVEFRHVIMKVDYVVAASLNPAALAASADMANIESFTKSMQLEYILEVGRDCRIRGGAWVRGSRTSHPDFLWRPYSKRRVEYVAGRSATSGISWTNVKMLLDKSRACSG